MSAKEQFLKSIPKFDYKRIKPKDHSNDIKIPNTKQFNQEFQLAQEMLKPEKVVDPSNELNKRTTFNTKHIPQARQLDLGLQTDAIRGGSKLFHPEKINTNVASFKAPTTLNRFKINHDSVDSLLRFYDNYLPQKYDYSSYTYKDPRAEFSGIKGKTEAQVNEAGRRKRNPHITFEDLEIHSAQENLPSVAELSNSDYDTLLTNLIDETMNDDGSIKTDNYPANKLEGLNKYLENNGFDHKFKDGTTFKDINKVFHKFRAANHSRKGETPPAKAMPVPCG